MLKPTERPGTLLVETNECDVFLGRGKNANNRTGNVCFRKLIAEIFDEYQKTDCGEEKTELAMKLVSRIHAKGGRFIRPVAAANSSGQQRAAWEVVSDEVAAAKVKQAVRDVAIGRKRKAEKERREQHGAIYEEQKVTEHSAFGQPDNHRLSQEPPTAHFQLHQQRDIIGALMQSQQQNLSMSSNINFHPPQQLMDHPGLINPQLLPAAMASMTWQEPSESTGPYDMVPMLRQIRQQDRVRQAQLLVDMLNAGPATQMYVGTHHPSGNQNEPSTFRNSTIAGSPEYQTTGASGSSPRGNVRDPNEESPPSSRSTGYHLEPSVQWLPSMIQGSNLQPGNLFGPRMALGLPSTNVSYLSSLGLEGNQQMSHVVSGATGNVDNQHANEHRLRPSISPRRRSESKDEKKAKDNKSESPS